MSTSLTNTNFTTSISALSTTITSNTSTATMQTQQTSGFNFLALPPRARHLIYSHVFEGIEDRVIFPITPMTQPTSTAVVPKKAPQELALLQTCKQINGEAFYYVHGRCKGYTYCSYQPSDDEVKCPACGNYHKPAWFNAMRHSISTFGDKLPFISHLEIRGFGAALGFRGYWGSGCPLSDKADLHTHRALKRKLNNIEVLTFKIEDEYADIVHETISGFRASFFDALSMAPQLPRLQLAPHLPRLQLVLLETSKGKEIIWATHQRELPGPMVPNDFDPNDWHSHHCGGRFVPKH